MEKFTPGVEAWLRYMPKLRSPAEAEYLVELGLATIVCTRREPVALSHPRVLSTVEPTEKALRLHRQMTGQS